MEKTNEDKSWFFKRNLYWSSGRKKRRHKNEFRWKEDITTDVADMKRERKYYKLYINKFETLKGTNSWKILLKKTNLRRNWKTCPAAAAAAAAKLLQSCPTLCDPRDGSSPGFPIPRILQARTLEWVAISFSTEACYMV